MAAINPNNEIQVGKTKLTVPYVLLIMAIIGTIGVAFHWGGKFTSISHGIQDTSKHIARFESATNRRIEKLEEAIEELQKQAAKSEEATKRVEELLKELLKEKQKGTK